MSTVLDDEEKQIEYKKILEKLLQDPQNSKCADCKTTAPRWASAVLGDHPTGVFICITCSGIHRSLGTHISFVRSVALDKWKHEEIQLMRTMGNAKASLIWEARLSPEFKRPSAFDPVSLEKFIRDKYQNRRYYKVAEEKPTTSKIGIEQKITVNPFANRALVSGSRLLQNPAQAFVTNNQTKTAQFLPPQRSKISNLENKIINFGDSVPRVEQHLQSPGQSQIWQVPRTIQENQTSEQKQFQISQQISISNEVPQQISHQDPQQISQQVPQQISQQVPQHISQQASQEIPQTSLQFPQENQNQFPFYQQKEESKPKEDTNTIKSNIMSLFDLQEKQSTTQNQVNPYQQNPYQQSYPFPVYYPNYLYPYPGMFQTHNQ